VLPEQIADFLPIGLPIADTHYAIQPMHRVDQLKLQAKAAIGIYTGY